MAKNTMAKTRNLAKGEKPYEIWKAGTWTWYVLKKWQANDDAPYARAFCKVFTPYVPDGELGDVYISEIKQNATLIETNY